ncbi:subtilisin-like protease Glyma18g48580 [Lotus japonicus]|uniref:subtilisin-like protease Glyma18g48580 n=1 Tax=Lotus japonicus TaxID=34305 RepID=UPI00258B6074|nr:subtilisin-like protease Glyma18g48580 [Lotus japonicus]
MLMARSILYLHLLVSSFLFLVSVLSAVHVSKRCYIVYLGAHSHGSRPSSVDLETATSSHYELLGSVLGSNEKAKEAIIIHIINTSMDLQLYLRRKKQLRLQKNQM